MKDFDVDMLLNIEKYFGKNALSLIWQTGVSKHKLINDTASLYVAFKNDILHKNRFNLGNELLSNILADASKLTINLSKGTNMYRARIIDSKRISEIEALFIKAMHDDSEKLRNAMKDGLYPIEISNDYGIFSKMKAGEIKENTYPLLKWLLKNNFIKHKDDFLIYSKEDMDAPPVDVVRAGRINPEGISYLYTATDIVTAINEVRPIIKQWVSVAQIKAANDLRIFNFCSELQSKKVEYNMLLDSLEDKDFDISDEDFIKILKDADDDNIKIDYKTLSRLLFETNHDNIMNYLPTQYIGEYIKKMGFDGIQYYSSLNRDGKNVVLFDTSEKKKYKIINNEVFFVSDIKIGFEKL